MFCVFLCIFLCSVPLYLSLSIPRTPQVSHSISIFRCCVHANFLWRHKLFTFNMNFDWICLPGDAYSPIAAIYRTISSFYFEHYFDYTTVLAKLLLLQHHASLLSFQQKEWQTIFWVSPKGSDVEQFSVSPARVCVCQEDTHIDATERRKHKNNNKIKYQIQFLYQQDETELRWILSPM